MWGVPVDHDIFTRVNPAQWLWYFHNFIKDEEEDFKSRRDMTEYHLSFVAPDVVQKIRKDRDETKPEEEAAFLKGVEKLFGRAIKVGDSDALEGDLNIDLDKIDDYMNNVRSINYLKGLGKDRNYRYWAEIDLGNN